MFKDFEEKSSKDAAAAAFKRRRESEEARRNRSKEQKRRTSADREIDADEDLEELGLRMKQRHRSGGRGGRFDDEG